jgi:hypothetical protein
MIQTGDTTMLTKAAIALAIIFSITSGAFAAPKEGPTFKGTTWQDPARSMMSWDAYGQRWD